ncbi:hypothetical protein NUW54_g4730 [Trametes sanguinea]|uniref:Uncharacterized protein n=1 Tax=Trametes sanguinea TaxID=158606 RepID=A0ACC1PXL8_9APHY|nr:hypothetical protein NUW54_g4730 [Trametes sanguinea]
MSLISLNSGLVPQDVGSHRETYQKPTAYSFYNFLLPDKNGTARIRAELRDALLDNVIYEDHGVEKRLLGQVHTVNTATKTPPISGDEQLVLKIVSKLRADPKRSLKALKDIADNADKAEEARRKKAKGVEDQVASDDRGKKEEIAMYPHLARIVEIIEHSVVQDQKRVKKDSKQDGLNYRLIICYGNKEPETDDPLLGNAAFDQKPDFVVADVPWPDEKHFGRTMHATSSTLQKGLMWRQLSAFMELKASRLDGPCPSKTSYPDIRRTLRQGADYARLILIARPYQYFVIGCFLCGTDFYVGWFDRGGIVMSSKYCIEQDDGLAIFVKFIIRLLWEMQLQDLGHHDTAMPIDDDSTYYGKDYPSLQVVAGTAKEPFCYVWKTIKKPMLASHSLLGRGTSISWALGHGDQAVMLKSALRLHQGKPPEIFRSKLCIILP